MNTMHVRLWCLSGLLFCLNVMAADANFDDQAFLNEVYCANGYEVQAGTIVAGKATSQDVVNFAKRMVTDHGKAKKDLDDLAAKKKWKLPNTCPDDQQKKLDRFSSESGATLESDYIKTMIEDHRATAEKIKQALNGISDSDLNSWARDFLSSVNKHLKDAEALGTK